MLADKMLLIGTIGAFVLAVGATLVSDMHGIGDWFVSLFQKANVPLKPTKTFGAPYLAAGYLGEPLLILSIILFSIGFYGAWLKYHRTLALVIVIVGALYVFERIFWAYVTINFSHTINSLPVIEDYQVLKNAGFLKGLGALFGGIIGGFLFSTLITIFFFLINNTYGKIGGLIVIISMLVGMPAKILFMKNISFRLVSIFFFSMVIKNIGIIFMGLGLFTESLK
jgi:hypothetical protein